MRWSMALVLLLLAALFGGCTDPDPRPDTPSEDTPSDPEDEQEEGNETHPEEKNDEVVVVTCEATAQAGVQVDGVGVVDNSPCRLEEAYGSNLSSFQAAVIEVTWDSLGAAADTVEIKIESDNCTSSFGTGCTHGQSRGQDPPLRLDLNEDTLQEYGEDNMLLYARPEPVASGQQFTVHLSLFEGDVPAEYTALE